MKTEIIEKIETKDVQGLVCIRWKILSQPHAYDLELFVKKGEGIQFGNLTTPAGRYPFQLPNKLKNILAAAGLDLQRILDNAWPVHELGPVPDLT